MRRTLSFILLSISIIAIFYFRHDILDSFEIIEKIIIKQPCTEPITYKINIFDERFGLSRADFKNALLDAENLWEDNTGINLFEYDTAGEMDINLVFDERQKTTKELEKIENEINLSKDNYQNLKKQYDYKKTTYDSNLKIINNMVAKYNELTNEYENEVKEWNDKGGAPVDVYEKLNKQKDDLDNKLQQINQKETKLKKEAYELNKNGKNLNQIARELNLDVETHNEVGEQFESEFEQGNYRVDVGVREINIYQFDNYDKLVIVLAHEMGHALGLEHIDNESALMYYKSIGQNVEITKNDINELKAECESKNTILKRLKFFINQ